MDNITHGLPLVIKLVKEITSLLDESVQKALSVLINKKETDTAAVVCLQKTCKGIEPTQEELEDFAKVINGLNRFTPILNSLSGGVNKMEMMDGKSALFCFPGVARTEIDSVLRNFSEIKAID